VFDSGHGLSTEEQEYNPTPIINEIRRYVEDWRNLPNPDQWQVTPETARLLQHWRHHQFQDIRPFFCQVEAVETVIWLTEVAPKRGQAVAKFWTHIRAANAQSNSELVRIALNGYRVGEDFGNGDADSLADGQCRPPFRQPSILPSLPRPLRRQSRCSFASSPRRRSDL